MAGVYRNRIVKTVLGICKVFSNFENAATLQTKQEVKKFSGAVNGKVLTRTKHRLVIALLGTKFRNNLLAFHKNDCIETYQVLDINNWRSQELVRH